jgi:D-arabinose 1-dehydrogenase-like Zn-dependent alcohol dehydrogenase
VVGVDARKEPLELAKGLPKNGADLLINADETSVEEARKQIKQIDPAGLTCVVVSTDAPPAFKYSLDILNNHSTFLLLGQPEEGITIPYQ